MGDDIRIGLVGHHAHLRRGRSGIRGGRIRVRVKNGGQSSAAQNDGADMLLRFKRLRDTPLESSFQDTLEAVWQQIR